MTDEVPPRVVLITGASSGIGRAVAHRLAGRDRLVLSSRSEESLAQVREECLERGASPEDVVVHPADVRDAAAVDGLVDAAVTRFGRLDAVAHCSGAIAYGKFTDVPAGVFDAAVATNLGGMTHVARSVLRQFHQQGRGHLVVTGSVLGKVIAPTMSAYATPKWAIHGLVRTLQVELRDRPDIDVSLVAPGGVDTPIYRQAGTYTGRKGSPLPPVATADEAAAVICDVLDKPRREAAVGRQNPFLVGGFRVLPGLYDAWVNPVFHRFAEAARAGEPPTPGNVLTPNPAGEAVSGGYDRWGRDLKEGRTMDTDASRAGHRKDPGPTISRTVAAPAGAVWKVLSDGWSYANWVVGAARVRDVDPGWPAQGTRVHHSFGLWPALIQDFTRVEKVTPGQDLVLTARGWPLGEARVHISVRPQGEDRCEVTITEDAVSGPGTLMPPPLRHALLAPRNKEALHRLAMLAEGHHVRDGWS